MSRTGWRSPFGRIWIRFFLFLSLAQVFTFLVGLFLMSSIGAEIVVKTTRALAVLIETTASTDDPARLARSLADSGGFQLHQGVVSDIAPSNIFHYPGLFRLNQILTSLTGGTMEMRMNPLPKPTIWLQKRTVPVFELGIPIETTNLFMARYLFTTIGVITFLSLGSSWWFTKRISQPLYRLADSALALGKSRGHPAIEVDPESVDEVRHLAQALNRMRSDLDRALQEQETFLSHISHDLRTPLCRMRLALEMTDAGQPDNLAGLQADIQEMSLILDQTTELARFDLERSEAWVEGDLNALLTALREKYRRAGIELSLQLAPLPPLRHKPITLIRLLYNLTDNALRHGGEVAHWESGLLNGQPALTITNPGIRSGDIVQTNSPLKPQSSGSGTSGLGLEIVRRIAEVHGADFRIEELPDGGRKTSLIFPGEAGNPGCIVVGPLG